MSNKKTSGAKWSISGFPEYSPGFRKVELEWLRTIATVFESYGYINIETPSVERVESLVAQGEDSDKEIYSLTRLGFEGDRAKFALHFDLTVPFARYVSDHREHIVFPFKRYQMQRVWRGERPQEGRYREFTQCDIDVVNVGSVSSAFDLEVLEVVIDALSRLSIGPVHFQISSRKLLDGLCAALGIEDTLGVARSLDKIDKMPSAAMLRMLVERNGLSEETARDCIAFASLNGDPAEIRPGLAELGIANEQTEEGLAELDEIFDALRDNLPETITMAADLSIVRGFDYYTGIVYEGHLVQFPEYPSICAGGRYESLLASFMNQKVPGVGISIGLTRIFTKLVREGLIEPLRANPSVVLVANTPEISSERRRAIARDLRERGMNCEIYAEADRLDRQLRYADRNGIPYVWFCRPGATDEVKRLADGVQGPAASRSWVPDGGGGHE